MMFKDRFFEFKWNNFLHSTVYDVVHQILKGSFESGLNKEPVLPLLRDAKLMHQVVKGRKFKRHREVHYPPSFPFEQSWLIASLPHTRIAYKELGGTLTSVAGCIDRKEIGSHDFQVSNPPDKNKKKIVVEAHIELESPAHCDGLYKLHFTTRTQRRQGPLV